MTETEFCTKAALPLLEFYIEKELELNTFHDNENELKQTICRMFDILKNHYDNCDKCNQIYLDLFIIFDEQVFLYSKLN